MEQGFIKLHRSILDWEWYKDETTKNVFLHLLLNANWEDSRFQGHEIPAGSLVTGRKELAESLGISEQSIRTALNHLKSTNEITIKSTNKFSIVSIVNWEKYQCRDVESNQQINQQLTNNQPTTNHIKEYKNIKNIRREEYFNSEKSNGRNLDFLKQLERETKYKDG